jgi:hypothetical protein
LTLYLIQSDIEKCQLEQDYYKFPPSKRPNYSKFQISSPFKIPFESFIDKNSDKSSIWVLRSSIDTLTTTFYSHLSTCFVRIQIQMLKGGLPEMGDLIYFDSLPNPENSSGSNSKHLLHLSSLPSSSSHIGYALDGKQSFRSGKGKGYGFVHISSLPSHTWSSLKSGRVRGFLRHKTSFQLYPIRLRSVYVID